MDVEGDAGIRQDFPPAHSPPGPHGGKFPHPTQADTHPLALVKHAQLTGASPGPSLTPGSRALVNRLSKSFRKAPAHQPQTTGLSGSVTASPHSCSASGSKPSAADWDQPPLSVLPAGKALQESSEHWSQTSLWGNVVAGSASTPASLHSQPVHSVDGSRHSPIGMRDLTGGRSKDYGKGVTVQYEVFVGPVPHPHHQHHSSHGGGSHTPPPQGLHLPPLPCTPGAIPSSPEVAAVAEVTAPIKIELHRSSSKTAAVRAGPAPAGGKRQLAPLLHKAPGFHGHPSLLSPPVHSISSSHMLHSGDHSHPNTLPSLDHCASSDTERSSGASSSHGPVGSSHQLRLQQRQTKEHSQGPGSPAHGNQKAASTGQLHWPAGTGALLGAGHLAASLRALWTTADAGALEAQQQKQHLQPRPPAQQPHHPQHHLHQQHQHPLQHRPQQQHQQGPGGPASLLDIGRNKSFSQLVASANAEHGLSK